MENDTLRNFILNEVKKMIEENDNRVVRYYRKMAKSSDQEEREED